MKQTLKSILTLYICFVLCGCGSLLDFFSNDSTPLPPDPKERAEQELILENADLLFEDMKFSEAENQYRLFIKSYPHSIFYHRAQLGLARSLDMQRKSAESIQLYRDTVNSSQSTQPDIAVLALFFSSWAYENVGQEEAAVTALKDVEARANLLPREKALAELPARLAALYNKTGQIELAQKYFKLSERGFAQAYPDAGAETSILKARSYYLIGQISNEQLSIENIKNFLDTLSMVQIFTLKSIETGQAKWSRRALGSLINSYEKALATVMNLEAIKSKDELAAEKEKIETQQKWIVAILVNLEKLDMYTSSESFSNSGIVHAELKKFINEYRIKCHTELSGFKELNLETIDSRERKSLKKNIKLEAPNTQGN